MKSIISKTILEKRESRSWTERDKKYYENNASFLILLHFACNLFSGLILNWNYSVTA